MIIKPKSNPNWKEGLIVVLLIFFLWKTNNTTLNILAYLIIFILSSNFLIITFLLFQINLFSVGNKVVFKDKNKYIQNENGELFTFENINYKKILFSNLYIVKFLNSKKEYKRIILNEAELLILELLNK